MKKRFTNGLLLVAFVAATLSSFVSCKDTEEDRYSDLQMKLLDNQYKIIRDVVEVDTKALEDKIKALEDQLATIKSCTCGDLDAKLAEYLKIADAANTYLTKVDAALTYLTKDGAAATYATKAELENVRKNLQTSIDNINTAITNIQTEIANLKAEDALLNTRIDSLKAAHDAAISALNTKYDNQQAEITALTTQVNNLSNAVKTAQSTADEAKLLAQTAQTAADNAAAAAAAAKTTADAAKTAADNAAAAAAAAQKTANEAKTAAATAQTAAQTAQAAAEAAQSTADEAKSAAATNAAAITTINTTISEMQTTIATLETNVTKALGDAADAMEKAKANKVTIDSLINVYNTTISQLQDKDNDLARRIDSLAAVTDTLASKKQLQEVLDSAIALYNRATAYTDSAVAVAINQITSLEERFEADSVRLNQVEAAYKLADQALQDQIDDLNDDITELNNKISEAKKAIEKLNNQFTNVMAKQITSIILQGSTNRVTGSINLPLDMRSIILAGFYGKVGDYGVEFPTTKPRYYATADDIQLTAKDLEMLGSVEKFTAEAGEILMDEKEGNAGTLFLTVNPNTVNFEGTEFTLVNSLDEESPMKLGDLKKSDRKLSFGFSRADNGFYQATATFDKKHASKLAPRVSRETLKSIKNNIVDATNGERLNLSRLALDVFNASTDILDADAVKATWEDSLGTHSFVSQYGIAATAIQPLSYAFRNTLRDKMPKKFPGIGRIEKFLGKFIDEIQIKIPVLLDHDIVIERIDSVKMTDEQMAHFYIVLDTTVVAKGETIYYDKYDEATGTFIPTAITIDDRSIDILLSRDLRQEMDKILDDLNGGLHNLDGLVDEVNSLLKSLRTYDKDVEQAFADAKDDIKSKLLKYVENLNNRLMKIMDRAAEALDPILIVNDGGYTLMSGISKNSPTYVKKEKVELLPTSYTGELVCPAFKKFVAVTNVYKADALSVSAQDGDANCKDALDAVNSQSKINEVLNGERLTLSATFQKGYVYEIVYTAVDYHGKVDAKKFYLAVK